MSAIMVKSPDTNYSFTNMMGIFMAGSIEMGKAVDWQSELFEKTKDLPIVYLNPRRDNWDSSWAQEMSNPKFSEQVNWELNGIYDCNHQVFVFDPNTTSPITLLELGLSITFDGIIGVVCPKGYFRKGNVDIICDRYDVPVVETIDELVELIREKIKND